MAHSAVKFAIPFRTALVLTCFLVFARVLSFDILKWDDDSHLVHNRKIEALTWSKLKEVWTTPHYAMYVPTVYTSWLTVGAIAGVANGQPGQVTFDPRFFHGANLLIHILNCLILFSLIKRLLSIPSKGASSWPAFFGALFFALHPVQVETVAWISELRDLLATFCALLVLHIWISGEADERFSRNTWLRTLICLLIYAIGFLAKPGIVMLPLIMAVIAAHVTKRSIFDGKPLLKLSPFFLLSGLVYLITIDRQGTTTMIYVPPLWSRPLVALDSINFYFQKLMVPYPLLADYGRRYQVLVEGGDLWLLVLKVPLLAFLLYKIRQWNRSVSLFLVLYAVAIFPVSGILPFKFQQISTVADHYNYFPLVFGAIAVSHFSLMVASPFRLLLGFWLLGLAAVSSFHLGNWRSTETLARSVLNRNPNSHAMMTVLGHQKFDERKYADAETLYGKALEIEPNSVETRNNLGLALYLQGKTSEAIRQFQTLAQHPAVEPHMLVNLGDILSSVGRSSEAVEHLQRAISLTPNNGAAYFQLAQAYRNLGLSHAFETNLAKAIELDPSLKKLNSGNQPVLEKWITPR